MKSLAGKIRKLMAAPEKALFFLGHLVDVCRVRKVWIDGKLHHRYEGDSYPDELNHGNAMERIRETALIFCRGQGLDIGADQWPLPGATPIREEDNLNAYRLNAIPDGSQDFIFSSHCLEHLERWDEAIPLWITKLRPGGVMFLYLPHEKMKLWKPRGPWSWTSHCWQPRMGILIPFLRGSGLRILKSEEGPDAYWSFWIAAEKPSSPTPPC